MILKDYIMEMINQRLKKLQIFDKIIQTHMIEEITEKVIKKKINGINKRKIGRSN